MSVKEEPASSPAQSNDKIDALRKRLAGISPSVVQSQRPNFKGSSNDSDLFSDQPPPDPFNDQPPLGG